MPMLKLAGRWNAPNVKHNIPPSSYFHMLYTVHEKPHVLVKCEKYDCIKNRLSSRIVRKIKSEIFVKRETGSTLDFSSQVHVWLVVLCVSKILNAIPLTVDMKRSESYLLMKLSAPIQLHWVCIIQLSAELGTTTLSIGDIFLS